MKFQSSQFPRSMKFWFLFLDNFVNFKKTQLCILQCITIWRENVNIDESIYCNSNVFYMITLQKWICCNWFIYLFFLQRKIKRILKNDESTTIYTVNVFLQKWFSFTVMNSQVTILCKIPHRPTVYGKYPILRYNWDNLVVISNYFFYYWL